MRRLLTPILVLGLTLFTASFSQLQAADAKVLVVHGQNNHDNDRTAAALIEILDSTGLFEISESKTPAQFERAPRRPKGELTPEQKKAHDAAMADYMKRRAVHEAKVKAEWQTWSPDFASADAVVLSYNGEGWPASVEEALEEYVTGGGTLINVHASNNPFSDWEAFNQMIGLGWRRADFGHRVIVNEDGSIQRIPPGEDDGAGHGAKHPYLVKVHVTDHPITEGIPELWMHGFDELYHSQRGPAENMTVIASAFDSEDIGGTGKREPMIWKIPFGEGMVVTNVMGHLGRGQEEMDALYCVGFQTIFARTVEYCATGEVTLPVPADFPGAEEPVVADPAESRWEKP